MNSSACAAAHASRTASSDASGPAEAHVLGHARGEDHRVLRHQRDRAAQVARIAVRGCRRRRCSTRPDADRRSAGAARRRWTCPRPRARPAPRARPGATVNDTGPSAVASGPRRDRRTRPRRSGSRRRRAAAAMTGAARGERGLRVEQLHQPLGGARGALDLAPHLGHRARAAGHDRGIEHERRKLAGGQAPGEHVVAADPQDHADRAEADQHHQRDQPRLDADAVHARRRRRPRSPALKLRARARPRGRRPARCGSRAATRRRAPRRRRRGPG